MLEKVEEMLNFDYLILNIDLVWWLWKLLIIDLFKLYVKKKLINNYVCFLNLKVLINILMW